MSRTLSNQGHRSIHVLYGRADPIFGTHRLRHLDKLHTQVLQSHNRNHIQKG